MFTKQIEADLLYIIAPSMLIYTNCCMEKRL